MKPFVTLILAAFVSACTAKPAALLTPVTSKEMKAILSANGSQTSVVNLWATWCEPCKTEMPELLKFHRSPAGKDVRLILISADELEDESKAHAFLKSVGVDFETFRLNEAPDLFMKTWIPAWGATLPTTLITDGKGQMKTFWVGETNQKALESKLAALEKAPQTPPVLPRHVK